MDSSCREAKKHSAATVTKRKLPTMVVQFVILGEMVRLSS
jgi:hypothetical protein